MTSSEELFGLIHGLAGAIRDQHASSKDTIASTQQQIQDLSQAVAESSTSVRSRDPGQATLRLPPLSLPEFTGGEYIDRFAEQLTQVLHSSNIHSKFWIPYLKQQCQKDSRAFDVICSFELSQASNLSPLTSAEEFSALYEECLQQLCMQRGLPKEQQIRNLLATYYSMRQNPAESVSNFAHRFLETQHSLEKLIPGIHTSPDGNQMELVHAFCMKLQPEISKFLLSRKQPFADILTAIECAKRHEAVLLPQPESAMSQDARYAAHPAALYTAHPAHPARNNPPRYEAQREAQKPTGMKKNEVCRNFNRFSPSRCELPNNNCTNGFIHKCSICSQFNCKAVNHNNAPPSSNSARRTSVRFSGNSSSPYNNNRMNSQVSANVVEPSDLFSLTSVKQVVSDSIANLKQDITTSILSEVEKRFPPPPPSPAPVVSSSQDRIFGMPAITPSAPSSSVSALDLANRNILWTKITSAGASLPLPLDSCCSVCWSAKFMPN